jgi:hypothetical protein
MALTTLLMATSALAKDRLYSPVAHEGQEVRFTDGEAVLITGNGIGNLAVSFAPFDKKWGYLRVWAENASDQQFNIAETSITASSAGEPLRVMTYADLVKALKKKEAWAAFWTGLAAGANSYSASQAGYTSYSGGYNARTYAGGYSATTQGSYYGRSYNGGMAYLAQANANAQNEAMFDRFHSASAAAAKDLQKRSLKANTLMPGQSVLGDVRFELPKSGDIELRIDLAGRPIDVTLHEGPVVVDSTPHAVVAQSTPATSDAAHPASTAPESQPASSYSPPRPPISEAARANAFAHPSGPAARREFIKLGCEADFNLVSAAAGRAVFEATCGMGKRQLLECYGNGCRAMN